MPTLKLLRIHCHETTSGFGDDDVAITINGKKVWGVVVMGDDDTKEIEGVEHQFPAEEKPLIQVWEVDKGDDDEIGADRAAAGDAGKGAQRSPMSGDGSNYDLWWEVQE